MMAGSTFAHGIRFAPVPEKPPQRDPKIDAKQFYTRMYPVKLKRDYELEGRTGQEELIANE